MPSVGVLELLVILAIAAMWLIIPVATVVVLIRRRNSPTNEAIDVLRTRFARGEIDEAEYLRLNSMLRSR